MNQYQWNNCQGEQMRGTYWQQDILQQKASFCRDYYDPECPNSADSSDEHDEMQPEDFKEPVSNQFPENKQIQVTIIDRSHPEGKMPGKTRKSQLSKALYKMMYRELLSDADIKPRFRWSKMIDNVFILVAMDESSAEFLRDRVKNMPPPWPGAKLLVKYKSERIMQVEMYVPGEFVSLSFLTQKIKEFEDRFPIQNWIELNVRPDGQGHVYTISIDSISYELIDQYNGYVPYVHGAIQFRSLNYGNCNS